MCSCQQIIDNVVLVIPVYTSLSYVECYIFSHCQQILDNVVLVRIIHLSLMLNTYLVTVNRY